MTTNQFKLICVEGADKCGKTTLCNAILDKFPAMQYRHFTACNKSQYGQYDIPLQRNVNVMYQFYRFFQDTFYQHDHTLYRPFLLDRTLYSDIVYGPIYRGWCDELIVRRIEKNFFTMMLQGLGAIFIFADNSDIDGSYDHIISEAEGVIKTRAKYDDLRASYKTLMHQIQDSSALNWLNYDFNSVDTNEFVNSTLVASMSERDTVLELLIRDSCLGKLIGTTKPTKYTAVYRLAGPVNSPITLQEYADLIVDTGLADLSVDSPLMLTNQYCIVRENSGADRILTQYINSL